MNKKREFGSVSKVTQQGKFYGYAARITVKGERKYLGIFKMREQAEKKIKEHQKK